MEMPAKDVRRPQVIEHGDVWWEPIEEILKRGSIDNFDGPDGWEETLRSKKDDKQYAAILLSIEERGFIRPLTCLIGRNAYGMHYQFGDGHHRLAAAIELGYTHVPLEAFDEYDGPLAHHYFGGAVNPDSGDWEDFNDPIATENISCDDEWDYLYDEEEF